MSDHKSIFNSEEDKIVPDQHVFQLKSHEEIYQNTLNALNSNICVIDETGVIVMINNSWEKFSSENSALPDRAGIGTNYLRFCENTIGDERKQALDFAEGICEVLQGIRGEFSQDYQLFSSCGDRWYNGKVTPLTDKSKRIIGAVISHEKIMREKNDENMFKQFQHYYESFFNITDDFCFVLDMQMRIIFANTSAIDRLNYTKEELYGNSIYKIFHDKIPYLQAGEPDTYSVENYTNLVITESGDNQIPVETVVRHGIWDNKHVKFVIAKDISRLKLSEENEEEIRRLNQNILNLQEEERQRVARDLHDSVGQIILAAKINIDTYKDDPHRFSDRLDIGLNLLAMASKELRDIYMNLYPSILNDHGLETSVRRLVANMLEPAGLKTDIEIYLNPSPPHNICINLYRIIQEIISNVIKHSGAGNFDLKLICDEKTLKLSAIDDGKGFGEDAGDGITSGCGLSNIRNRVRHLNGSVSIEMNRFPGTGIVIIIDL